MGKPWGYRLKNDTRQADTILSEVAAPLTPEAVVAGVWETLSAKSRERVSREDIAHVVHDLELGGIGSARKAPALQVKHLRFTGEKKLNDQLPQPFVYDQEFEPGVNVICVPDNSRGKSSILKTIKFALTGDNEDYDADVRSWITDVWLTFSLDHQVFTVLHNMQGQRRAVLVPGEEFRSLEVVPDEATVTLMDETGADSIRAELKHFFFKRFSLEELSWTQQDLTVPTGVAKRSTSWLTYFQALQIREDGDAYLLVDAKHAIGNQDGLIFSAFLGLNLAEPLNRLGVEEQLAKKAVTQAERLTAEQVQVAQADAARLDAELKEAQKQTQSIHNAQAARRTTVVNSEPARRLAEVNGAITSGLAEQRDLEVDREQLGRSLKQLRARERQLREAVAINLHFTGIEVNLCPNCDHDVDSAALERERVQHECRLCGKPAGGTDQAQIEAFEAEANALVLQVKDMERVRGELNRHLGQLRNRLELLQAEAAELTAAAAQGLDYALLSPEEQAELTRLYEQIGRLQANLVTARQRAERPAEQESELKGTMFAVQKVRQYLRKEAATRNEHVLTRLSALTQEAAQAIGVESVSDVSCSPLGKVDLKKHGRSVGFGGVQNQGERMRIKLAFFLAMMRLGREPGLGRHPGFLLIDQPGSGEMATEDFQALAHMFRELDAHSASGVQLICATARAEFEAAYGT